MKTFHLPNGKALLHNDGTHVVVVGNNWAIFDDATGNLVQQGIFEDPFTKVNLIKPELKINKVPTRERTNREIDLGKIKVSDLYRYDNLSKYQGLTGKIPVRADTTYVGVEIELEKVKTNVVPEGTWKVTEDGSLKDNGAEFVTIPIQFRYLEVELERLFGGIKKCHASTRCSVHVHINSRDFTLQELKSFIALYMIFERSLYRFCGDRWNNNFCVPLHFSPQIVRHFIQEMDKQSLIPEKWNKYFGFNLCPLFGGESHKIGTIEFRQMKGNTNVEWIINWINLIVSLKISAKKIPFEEIITHLKTMNTTSGYFWLAKEVFRNQSESITTQETFKEDVESCIALAKTVFLTVNQGKEVICAV